MAKDWTGNQHSIYKTLGASNHTEGGRQSDDYYATEPKAAELLLEQEDFHHTIWECACGEGHLAKVFEQHGHEVIATDLIYRGYGGRGITVCEDWRNDYAAFRDWAMANGYDENALYGECTIDRIDNDKGYSPDNCRWVSMKEQSVNKRTAVIVEIDGEIKPLKEWCSIFKISYSCVMHRIARRLRNPFTSRYNVLFKLPVYV